MGRQSDIGGIYGITTGRFPSFYSLRIVVGFQQYGAAGQFPVQPDRSERSYRNPANAHIQPVSAGVHLVLVQRLGGGSQARTGIEAVGQAVFVDLLNLASGERWESVIHQQIARCDVFYLFWSSEAKRSKWVKHEWQYALALRTQRPNQTPDIIAVIIEGPPPPEPLRYLHFNDRHLYFIGKS